MRTLRIKFEKTGLAKYISHLDLNRVFARAFARAKIELAHSEGFNPRPKIVFASAISLGIESLCEFVDIKITDEKTPAAAAASSLRKRIEEVLPEGINILEVYEPEYKFKDINSTRYNIFTDTPDKIDIFPDTDILVEKKPGVIINLKDYILDLNITEGNIIDVTVKTNPEMYLNPENIIKGINLNHKIDDYAIKKIEVYNKDNTVFK
jgi:radical SAM-linked protein